MRPRLLTLVAVTALVAASCTGDAARREPTSDLVRPTAEATFDVRGTIGQVAVTGAEPGTVLAVFDAGGDELQRGSADDLGTLLFRGLAPGRGYRVQAPELRPAPTSRAVRVLDVEGSLPPQSLYDGQRLEPGFQYLRTRDGTTLSASVYLPGPVEAGPYPTVVEYSGYSVSDPTGSGPDQPASLLASALGYAVVAVNVRGTGCSGGAFDFFEPLQVTDGYDVIETVAAQRWVAGGRVGMIGISYSGISQLFVAAARPPHLAAITPLSVYDDTLRGVLAPGGVVNSGFALSWVQAVLRDAQPSGVAWVREVIDTRHDTVCAANQRMRLQNVDLAAAAARGVSRERAEELSPIAVADRVQVPVFLGCAWQDEQTGGRCARLTGRFTSAPVARATLYNGTHADGFSPQVLVEVKTFLDLYVAGRLTPISPLIRELGPFLLQQLLGVAAPIPPERLLDAPDIETARRRYEAEPPVRVIFESGAASGVERGAPVGRFDASYPSFPPPDVGAERWFLHGDGALAPDEPAPDDEPSSFRVDADLAGRTNLPTPGDAAPWAALPDYDWRPDPDGSAVAFTSAALGETRTYAGTASADLWISSTAPDADLSVTLSEVRPDGTEMYVQSGWLRASHRALADDATELDPDPSADPADVEPLRPGALTRVRVEVFPFAHVVRAGSRLRLSIHTPGGDRPRWSWTLADGTDGATVRVAHDAEHPSALVLPRVADVAGTPRTPAPCPSLRGQPCRAASAGVG